MNTKSRTGTSFWNNYPGKFRSVVRKVTSSSGRFSYRDKIVYSEMMKLYQSSHKHAYSDFSPASLRRLREFHRLFGNTDEWSYLVRKYSSAMRFKLPTQKLDIKYFIVLETLMQSMYNYFNVKYFTK